MTNQELATCAINDIPIKVAIINNASLGMVRQWQTLFYDERYSNTDLHTHARIPDFVKLAEAYGCVGLRCETAERRRRHHREGDGDQRPARSSSTSSVHHDAMVWPMVAAGTSNDDIKYARDMAPDWDRGGLTDDAATPCPSWSRTSPVSWPGSRACSPAAASTSTPSPSARPSYPAISRMTIVVNVEELPLEQVTKQLNKLVNVIKIVELDPAASVQRELLLVKVRADVDTALAGARDRPAVPGQGRRRRPRRGDHRGHRRPPTSSRRCCGCSSRSAIRELVQSGHGRHRPRAALDHRARRALDRPHRLTADPPARRLTSAPGSITADQPADLHPRPRRTNPWPRCSTTTTPTCRSSRASKVAVIGYGSQGHAHALSLRDSGVDVRVGLPEGSKSRAKAEAEGLRVVTPAEAAAEADVIMILAPDHVQRQLYAEAIEPQPGRRRRAVLRPRLQHPLRLHQAAGRRRRRAWSPPRAPATWCAASSSTAAASPCSSPSSRTRPATPGRSRSSYAKAIGGLRAGGIKTTFTEETETDLFGEQAVLCGGASQLVQYGFETLIEAGYQPEVAYFECLHELKLIVDLMYEGGIAKQRWSVSDTAEYGDYVSGPRVIDPHVKENMKAVLADIQNGAFAERFIDDQDAGAPEFKALRAKGEQHPIEDDRPRAAQADGWVESGDADYTEGTAAR